MNDDVLVLQDLTKRFGDRDALSGVSFRIRGGESVGYLGPNGAGKTTTLKLLAGLLVPDSGNVRLFGRDPRLDSGSVLAQVGALIETPGIAPYLHGRDLLDYVAKVRKVPTRDRTRELQRVAERMGIEGHLDRAIGSLSTGLARRLLLASALIGQPKLLLLDEPTLGLDPAARRDLRSLVRELHREGASVLLSTHLLDDVEEVCDRVLFLRDGRIIGDEPVQRDSRAADEPRSVRFRFLTSVEKERLTPVLRPGEAVEVSPGLEATITFRGGDARQAELLAGLLHSGVPVVGARTVSEGLAERYLATVGREEDL